MNLDELNPHLIRECRAAYDKFGHFKSSHEGLGVALEEFRELSDAIHANNAEAIKKEAIQHSR